ncbi:MAG TPA: diaminopimelate epimerase [Acidobacteriaceae bacterium]|nr:diaminopimelate epimerase [Acidobacteriaceae bacterium]
MIPFVKAHACGNDFLVIQEILAGEEPRDVLTRRLCHRNQGIGADGVEFLTWQGERRGRILLHNADGSIAEISGNGTRCVAAWVGYETKSGPGDEIVLETGAGPRLCRIDGREGNLFHITSSMGIPGVVAGEVPLSSGEQVQGAVVSTGNPHFVIFVDGPNFNDYPWESIGQEICNHPIFSPQQTNVEFVRTISRDEIEIRIYERGVGPTSSSGTGTCASASAAIALRGAAPVLRVIAPGGAQTVDWQGPGSEIQLTGPAELICFGEVW